MTGTLLLISIGPVQDFIASARKLRDLWTGSWMLSEFSKTVARTLAENGAELIFPAPESEQQDKFSGELLRDSELVVANKILAAVKSPEEANELQTKAREAWRDHFASLGRSTLSVLGRDDISISVDTNLFKAELEDYGEFYAAWTAVNNSDSYKAARSRVENLLASRKNFRSFNVPSWDGTGISKNSLDGMRENVIKGDPEEITGLLKKHEKLDAIGCIKRFGFLASGMEKKHFSDLAEIALVPWLLGAETPYQGLNEKNTSRKELIEEFQSLFPKQASFYARKHNFFGDIKLVLGAENFFLNRVELEKKYPDKVRNIWDFRKRMVCECGEPSQYSVIMVGDGDRMGKMIDAITDKKMHKLFSKKLSEFSKNVASVVEKAGGSLIYAGGDDVMAYLPLHTALSCSDSIRKMFHDEMKELSETIGLDIQKASTFSAGLAVVHYKYPLDRALNLARKAESIAKDAGRNSLALIQSKRAGADITVFGKWDTEDGVPGIVERFDAICNLYSSDRKELPSTLGYDLRRVRIDTGGNKEMKFISDAKDDIRPANAVAALVLRVFNQKNDGDADKNKRLRKLLLGRTDVDQLSKELVVGRLISDAQIMAEGQVQDDD